MNTKPFNQKAWFLILPVILCVAFSAILPLMTVVNYSVQDIISPERRVFVGTEWFAQVMRDEELHAALLRQLTFSLAVLLVEIPLGIALALSMPAQGWKASAVLVIVALSFIPPVLEIVRARREARARARTPDPLDHPEGVPSDPPRA